MPDPLYPSIHPPSSKHKKQENVIDEAETINVSYKKRNRAQDFVIVNIITQGKNSSFRDEKNLNKPLLLSLNQFETKPPENMSSPSGMDCKKPSILSKLSSFKIRLPSFLSGLFGSKKMSDKQPGRPMKYPYTLSAKIAQFPYKFYFNNNWMWKYYIIAIGVSFPLFYKLSRASNTPENIKVWEEIRKRDFAPGGHH